MIRREGDKEIPEPFSDEVSGELEVMFFIIVWYAVSDILLLKSFFCRQSFSQRVACCKERSKSFWRVCINVKFLLLIYFVVVYADVNLKVHSRLGINYILCYIELQNATLLFPCSSVVLFSIFFYLSGNLFSGVSNQNYIGTIIHPVSTCFELERKQYLPFIALQFMKLETS